MLHAVHDPFSALTTLLNRYFSIYTSPHILRTILWRPTCRAAKDARYPRRGDPAARTRVWGNWGKLEVMGCSGFLFFGASLAVFSSHYCLSLELPEAARHFAPRDSCVPITVHGSRLPFRRRSSWNKQRRTQTAAVRVQSYPSPERSTGAAAPARNLRLPSKPRFRAATPPADSGDPLSCL